MLARLVAGLLGMLVVSATAAAQPTATGERRVMELVFAGRCDEALTEITALRRQQDSAPLARTEGQCRIRLKDFAGAVAALDAAHTLDPALEDVEAFRGIALYRLEDYVGAREALVSARGHTSASVEPQLELYTGLVQLQDGESRAAAESLDRARLLDAGQVEPVASFYAGLAWQSVGERELARESLLRVQAADPEGVWGKRAGELLSGRSFEERAWASLLAGLEYDSNVVLLGEAVPLPQGISNQDDGRAIWFLDSGLELFHRGKWSGGLAATYAGNVQFELRDFDIQYPRGAAWLDYDLDADTLIRAHYGIGYAWVDYSPFLFTQDATLSLFRNWGRAGNTEIGLGWTWNDYRYYIIPVPQGSPGAATGAACPAGDPFLRPCAPFGVVSDQARNRDGSGLRPFFVHRFRLLGIDNAAVRHVELRGGYGYARYWAEGIDWDYQSHEFLVGAKATLVWDVRFDSQLGFTYRPFTFASSYPDPPTFQSRQYALSTDERLDEIANVGVTFEKDVTDHVSVSARYLYTRSISNVEVFDYSRHVTGAYVKYRF